MRFKEAGVALLDLIFPPRCIFCRAVIPSGTKTCKKCEKQILCIHSAKYMNVPELGKTIPCMVPYSYSGQVRQSIIRFKFQNQKQFAAFYAEKMAEEIIQKYLNVEFDTVTSVPISAKRRKFRGYNQSELIARDVARRIDIPYRDCLMKVTDNQEQHKLSEKERRQNVHGAYRPLNKDLFVGKKILLIDDIVTTGATLCECALVLFRSGAQEVACAAIAEVCLN
jgi:competence protein ComFC